MQKHWEFIHFLTPRDPEIIKNHRYHRKPVGKQAFADVRSKAISVSSGERRNSGKTKVNHWIPEMKVGETRNHLKTIGNTNTFPLGRYKFLASGIHRNIGNTKTF